MPRAGMKQGPGVKDEPRGLTCQEKPSRPWVQTHACSCFHGVVQEADGILSLPLKGSLKTPSGFPTCRCGHSLTCLPPLHLLHQIRACAQCLQASDGTSCLCYLLGFSLPYLFSGSSLDATCRAVSRCLVSATVRLHTEGGRWGHTLLGTRVQSHGTLGTFLGCYRFQKSDSVEIYLTYPTNPNP